MVKIVEFVQKFLLKKYENYRKSNDFKISTDC